MAKPTYDVKPRWVEDRRYLAVGTHIETGRHQILVAFYVRERAELYLRNPERFTHHKDVEVWDQDQKRWPNIRNRRTRTR